MCSEGHLNLPQIWHSNMPNAKPTLMSTSYIHPFS